MERRVVVTGMGVVSPIGMGIEKFWQSCIEGRSGVKRIARFDTSEHRTKVAAEVEGFHPEKIFGVQKASFLDRISQFALTAVFEAMSNSGLKITEENRNEVGIICGTSQGGIISIEEQYRILFTKGFKFTDPMSVPKAMHVASASNIAIHYGIMGPNYTVCNTCSSGAIAIGEAYRLIKHGYAEAMISGGADACITLGMLSAWCKLRALSVQNDPPERACKPFSKNRDGLILGEGAGFVVLESLESALKRNAPVMVEIIGYGLNNDAHHLTFPSVEGEVLAMNFALKGAGLSPKDVDYINAHGTGTQINDKGETEAIKRVFGERSYSIPVSSTKSMIGHTLGAAGAIEFITAALSIQHKIVPPTINYEVPDPECDLDYVPNQAREKDVTTVLSNSFGFGGGNAVLIARRFS